mmetsp:Transcript_16425/g.39421  ORF Transcript_16425/g.39421 Transcript_16425/m.39421 type:complete len:254 (+) Transcript_16425:238-999(+)
MMTFQCQKFSRSAFICVILSLLVSVLPEERKEPTCHQNEACASSQHPRVPWSVHVGDRVRSSGAESDVDEGRDQSVKLPAWVQWYARLHRDIVTQQVDPEDQKLLIWTCGVRKGMCSGWGNRVLGMASAFILAAVSDRAFLIDWPDSGNLSLHRFARSAVMDWRVPAWFLQRGGSPLSRGSVRVLNRGATSGLELINHFTKIRPEFYTEQAVYLKASHGLFVGMWQNPHWEEVLCGLGLQHIDDLVAGQRGLS